MRDYRKPKHKEAYRYERCRECGREWNVSYQKKLSPLGYLCPACTYVRAHTKKAIA